MAYLDPNRDAVVVRIVYDGLPTSGKTTSLRALAEGLHGSTLFTPEEASGRTLYFDWLEYTGGRFDGRPIHCQVVSVPGQKALAARRELLLSAADAVVMVADTSPARAEESRLFLQSLLASLQSSPGLPVGVVLQANKRDTAGAAPLALFADLSQLAVVESVASRGEGIREAFVFAVRLALDRAREQLRRGELKVETPGTEPAAALLETLRSLPLGAAGEALWTTPSAVPTGRLDRAPRLPDVTVPAGWVWPPVQGRVLLHEAIRVTPQPPSEVSPGEWMTSGANGWRFHSLGIHAFVDQEEARTCLLRWAQFHAARSEWVSHQRCIALCETGDGALRLWQAVREMPSLQAELNEAFATQNDRRILEVVTACERAVQRWTHAPRDLPCTLDSVGIEGGQSTFIGWMPPPESGGTPSNETAPGLRRELESFVRARVGVTASRIAV